MHADSGVPSATALDGKGAIGNFNLRNLLGAHVYD